ncbi:MAG: class I SAM-dependent methyltransferase [Acetobacteraceae bacterium]|nr:class I SAM-dependent methyltransferase [Acetobacteraceae bacterium]
MSADHPIELCLEGQISPPVMVARLVLEGLSVSEIEQRLSARADAKNLLRFLAAHANYIQRLRVMLAAAGISHSDSADLAAIAARFDAAAGFAPEASVAAYSLGNPSLLEAMTSEIVSWLEDQRLIGAGADVLDLGCGIGRVAGALAGRVRFVLGIDISTAMIAEARRRYSDHSNLRFDVTTGESLRHLPDDTFDLVLAVDTFPYMFQAGPALVHTHVEESARVLRRNGALVIMNLTYGPDPFNDAELVNFWAAECGFQLAQKAVRPFNLWDGAVFVFHLAH